MKFGDVLKKERTQKKLDIERVANELNLSIEAYQKLEAGESTAEEWAPKLALLAVKLETPTSRLLATSGKSKDVVEGKCGELIKGHRERKQLALEPIAEFTGISIEELKHVEAGTSPIETWGWRFLRFAELIEQPVFNLFYPCGLSYKELDDYP